MRSRCILYSFSMVLCPLSLAYSIDLSTLKMTIPFNSERPVKLDLLASEMAWQFHKQTNEPFGIIIEHSVCKFNVGPEKGYAANKGNYSYYIKPSPYPILSVTPGDYLISDMRPVLENHGIVTIIDTKYPVIHFIQKELFDNKFWPINQALEKGTYGIADSTHCREILYNLGCDKRITESDFLSAPRAYLSGMVNFDFTEADSIRDIISAVAIGFSKSSERGSVIYVSPYPPATDITPPVWDKPPTWMACTFSGGALLHAGPEIRVQPTAVQGIFGSRDK